MKPAQLAHGMVWSVGLFAATYLFQALFVMSLGLRATATLLFVFLGVSAVFAVMTIRIFFKQDLEGLAAFGLISMFIMVVFILTRVQYFGIFLFILYCAVAIARLFKIVQVERKHRTQ